jgi:type VI secretion system secreted protein Hcp
MATDWFLKIDGIRGDSVDDRHAGEIDVLAWSWGVSQPKNAGPGRGGAGAGKADTGALTITTGVGRATPELFLSCVSGRHLSKVVLTGRKSGGKPIEFLLITFTDVQVSSVDLQGDTAANLPTHDLTLSFGQVSITHRAQRPDGSADEPVTASWDIRRNRIT